MEDKRIQWNTPMTSEHAAKRFMTRGFVAVELYDDSVRGAQRREKALVDLSMRNDFDIATLKAENKRLIEALDSCIKTGCKLCDQIGLDQIEGFPPINSKNCESMVCKFAKAKKALLAKDGNES